MSISLALRGIVIGLSIAAPVGPIGVLCIRRTLAEGPAYGLVSGLGAASADAVYGSIAGLGLGFVSGALVGGQFWLRLVGGAFLCYLGFRTFFATPAAEAARARGGGLLGAFASTFLLTLTNPMTIMSFAAIFAGLGLAESGGHESAAALVCGVFLGSALWWLTLSTVVGLLRGKLGAGALRWVNRVSGVVVAGFGLYALLGLLLARRA